jgi:DNA-binding transcriptional LysR family regulator
MEIRKLDVFCKVVELKSFTRAAEAALLSQPTVSEHIRTLEEELGLKLVDRMGREVEPTPAGQILYDYASRLLRLQQEALQAIARFTGILSGTVHIGASSIPGTYILPGMLGSFCRQHPEVKPFVHISDSRAIAAQVLDGTLDLGLVGAIWNERGLEWTTLFADTLVLAVPPDSPLAAQQSVAIDELFRHPCILREPGSGTRKVLARILDQQGLKEADLQAVAVLGSNEAIKEAIKAGLGMSIVSLKSIAEDVRMGHLAAVLLDNQGSERPISLIQRKNKEPSPVAAAFIAFLQTAAQQESPALDTP